MVIQHLTKQYGRKRVVDEVSFEIPQGQVLSLIGPNGAGKSTVMGMISRLVAKDAGLIHFEGQDLTKWNSRELSKRLAILTQSNNIQMKLTVRELVSFGRFPYCQGRLQPEDQEKVDQALAYMELDAIAGVVVGGTSLAGGVGSVIGTIIGVFIMSVLKIGLPYIDLQPHYQLFITGFVVIVAVYFDIFIRKNKKK